MSGVLLTSTEPLTTSTLVPAVDVDTLSDEDWKQLAEDSLTHSQHGQHVE